MENKIIDDELIADLKRYNEIDGFEGMKNLYKELMDKCAYDYLTTGNKDSLNEMVNNSFKYDILRHYTNDTTKSIFDRSTNKREILDQMAQKLNDTNDEFHKSIDEVMKKLHTSDKEV